MEDRAIATTKRGGGLIVPALSHGVAEDIAAALAPSTRRAYSVAWRSFEDWCAESGASTLPATAEAVRGYLDDAALRTGPSGLNIARCAINKLHDLHGLDRPDAHLVGLKLKALTRTPGLAAPRQAEGLTELRLARAEPYMTPRDVAMVHVMRDGLLRASECATLTWEDLTTEPDGSGRLQVRRHKVRMDQWAYVSPATMELLEELPRTGGRIIGIGPRQIGVRIKGACQRAGLGDGFSGHSPRVGMAQDLSADGAGLPEIMVAGGWRTASMVARYTERQAAGRGAVARYYARRE